MPRPTAQVAHYIEALGAETAVLFILRFGGAELYSAQDPNQAGMATRFLGMAKPRRLPPSRA